MDPTRRAFLSMAMAVSGAAVAGCRLQRPALVPRSFTLAVPPVAPAGRAEEAAGILLVRAVQVTPAFDSQAFILRRGESEYVTDPYHRFLVSPGPLLTAVLADWIRQAGIFRAVITTGSQLAPSHALEVDVGAWYGDYRDPSKPAAAAAWSVRLLHPLVGPPSQQVRWQREFRAERPIVRAAPEELVAGWNALLAEFLPELGVELQKRPAPGDGTGERRA